MHTQAAKPILVSGDGRAGEAELDPFAGQLGEAGKIDNDACNSLGVQGLTGRSHAVVLLSLDLHHSE